MRIQSIWIMQSKENIFPQNLKVNGQKSFICCNNSPLGIRVVGKGSWKVLNWKGQNEIRKIEVVKFEPKLASSWRSWKARAEVEKYN